MTDFFKYKGYTIFKNGDIIGKYNKKLSPKDNGKGYKTIGIHFDNKVKYEYIHRLIAIHFIPNPENKPCVNHIDGNKSNNSVDNLEWVSYSENVKHAYNNNLWNNQIKNNRVGKNSSKKVIDISNSKIFNSAKELSKELNINYTHLLQNLRGERRSKNLSKFKYLNK